MSLANEVMQMDRDAYRDALKKYGVSDRQLDKLRALDGLAKNAGHLLSISLQMTHQNYIGQLHNLADVADELKERLNPDMPSEEYAALSRAYIECVKEAGKGYGIMLTGTEAMVRMMAAAKGRSPSDTKTTHGWGPMKKVRDAK